MCLFYQTVHQHFCFSSVVSPECLSLRESHGACYFCASKIPSLLLGKSTALAALLLGVGCLLTLTAPLQVSAFLGAIQLPMIPAFSIRVSAWATRSVLSHTGVMVAAYCQTTSLRAGWLLWLNTWPAWDWCVMSTNNSIFPSVPYCKTLICSTPPPWRKIRSCFITVLAASCRGIKRRLSLLQRKDPTFLM